jgi:hypothetical protein
MLNEDTKLEVELSGEIDSSAAPAAVQEGVDKKSLFGDGMSLPVPISLSKPAVKEWFGRRKANVRPFGVFFNTSNFQVPPSAGRLTKRLYKNVEYFQSNYVLVFFVLVLYCLITSPLLIIVIAATGGACYIAGLKNAERKLSIAGHEVSLAQQYGLISLCSVPFFLFAGATGLLFWVLGASLVLCTAHAATYNYDALDLAPGEDTEQLVGAIVEEV